MLFRRLIVFKIALCATSALFRIALNTTQVIFLRKIFSCLILRIVILILAPLNNVWRLISLLHYYSAWATVSFKLANFLILPAPFTFVNKDFLQNVRHLQNMLVAAAQNNHPYAITTNTHKKFLYCLNLFVLYFYATMNMSM